MLKLQYCQQPDLNSSKCQSMFHSFCMSLNDPRALILTTLDNFLLRQINVGDTFVQKLCCKPSSNAFQLSFPIALKKGNCHPNQSLFSYLPMSLGSHDKETSFKPRCVRFRSWVIPEGSLKCNTITYIYTTIFYSCQLIIIIQYVIFIKVLGLFLIFWLDYRVSSKTITLFLL